MSIRITSALLLGAAALSIGFGLAPIDPVAETTTPARTREGTNYSIDPVHSTSIFRVHHLKAGMFYGMFDRVTGTIAFDPENPDATSFDISIDVASLHTGSEARNENLKQHLMSEDFFNAKEHGAMTFKSSDVSKVDDDTFEVKGELTIRGNTKPITVLMDLVGMHDGQRGKSIGFETTFNINRTDFDVNYMADTGMLGTDIRILISLEAGAD